jgi:hypothetical protein
MCFDSTSSCISASPPIPPFIPIDRRRVDQLRVSGLSWADIQTALGVSRNKLVTWRAGPPAYVDPLEHPTDQLLDEVVGAYILEYPSRGEVLT